ncbi:hypothetical protein FB45DRAFT_915249 [Roridomyces roridus]|uniref:Uncharacterized protein n=1 Tax=Roridomyces roridus TaxID=1738132 RepID=A0AAD7BTA0_9AGAR|nr:hypothetical protein FB45DRAFT_915249 [Roridomyces roridus]
MDDSDDSPRPPRSKWVPVAMLATGTVLIAAPLFYLWRIGRPNRTSLRAGGPAPPRRVVGGAHVAGSSSSSPSISTASTSSSATISTASTSLFTFKTPIEALNAPPSGGSDWDDDGDWGVPAARPGPVDPNDKFNGVLYSLKAFGSATLIVVGLAGTGMWGLWRYLGVDNVEDFGKEMRRRVMERMPLLAARMRGSLGGILGTSEAPRSKDPQEPRRQPWTWDGAEGRLSDAYSKGGIGAWADAAAREMEQEAKVEMSQREEMRRR